MGFTVFLTFLSLALSTFADEKSPATANLKLKSATVEAGASTDVELAFFLPKGFFAYSDKFKLELLSPDGAKLDKWRISPETEFIDPITKKKKKGVQNKTQLKSLVEFSPGLTPGPYSMVFQLTYQACTKEYCLFPKKITLQTEVQIKPRPQ